MDKIFSEWMPLAQPFFTTIPIAIGTTGQGTGLGLSLSYVQRTPFGDIVKEHGGVLRWLSSLSGSR